MSDNTVYALFTAAGKSGVAVFRVSGSDALAVVRCLTALDAGAVVPRHAYFTSLHDLAGEVLDHALVLYFKAPASFTGEDTVEIHSHGSRAVIAAVLENLGRLDGFRLAEPGEFSKRAFYNGKMDLTEAEGLADLIDAETREQQKYALRQMEGGLKNLYDGWREKLVEILAYLEAYIDFPDEELPSDLVDKLEFAFLTMPVRTASFAARLGVPSIIFGVLLGILRCCVLTGPLLDVLLSEGSAENTFAFSTFAASLFACAALIMAMLTLRKSRNFAFRVLVPLIAVLLVTLCTPYGTDGTFRCFALFGTYFMLEACLWVMYADIAQSYRVSAFTTFGFGHGLLSAGSLAGFLMLQPGGLLEAVSAEPMMLALVGLIALTLGVATLPNGAEMRSTLIRGRFCPLLDDQTDLEELMSGEGAASEPSIEEAIAPMPSDKPTVSSAPNAIPEGSIPAAQESPEQKAGRFKRKCAAVADTFLLSHKETEVLFLLAKGRNSAAIQEALYISAGTANTHMRHIYRKLDVHSQHELIDLVESMVVD